MPNETQDAVNWALQQTYVDGFGDTQHVAKDDPQTLVDKVREYFNANAISYPSFSCSDLDPYLN